MRIVRLLLALLFVVAMPAQAEAPGIRADSFEGRLLAAHNAERARLGFVPLSWNPQLAAQAEEWARDLARRGAFEHAQQRYGAGENLWMGSSGFFSPEAMVGAFINERRFFRAGRFPDVSTTGRWTDVGHFTQLIWPATRELGCARTSSKGRDILVCRYFPAGNVYGQQVP